ncbi:PfkB family carbohydrate kinase [Actinoplanes sp. NPDC048967]|uniref:1-phosphofructokinase family hexose kinase n=1 Tax=Actinoplanes sp. NPDC048967 TaxID=3155269 RepID=UPI0033FC2EBA
MIVTVTLNPALDLTYEVDALVPHGTHRVTTVAERPGGKGLNVAAVLHALGEPVLATGLLGGPTGDRVTGLLAGAGVPAGFVTIAGETRRTVAVADRDDATGFWEPGPRVTAGEWAAFIDHFGGLLAGASVVALSGSLPPGVPIDGYATLIRLAAAAGVPTVLDTSGEALRHGLAAGPDLAKPNAAELAALLAAPRPVAAATRDASQPVRAATGDTSRPVVAADRDASRTGLAGPPGGTPAAPGRREVADATVALDHGARAVVVSHGPRGLLALTGQGAWRGVPPERLAGNPTGAGDACVAALARGLRDRTPWPHLLADATALSAAAVAAPLAGRVDEDTYRRLLTAVRVSAA